MRRDWTPAATRVSGRTKRIAWLIGFVIPMVLLALMLALRPAAAATLPAAPTGQPPAAPAVIELTEPEEEAEEGGEAAPECAEEELEGEEAEEEESEVEEVEGSEAEEEGESETEEEGEGCGGKHRKSPPPQCLLRTARARLFAYSNRDRVRLVIRYTTFAPATVAVEYDLNGPRGAAKLGSQTRRFSASGLFRRTEKLSRREMAKVLAARGFTVTMDIAAAPKYCHRYYTRHLTVRRAVHGQTVWYQAGSSFGSRRK